MLFWLQLQHPNWPQRCGSGGGWAGSADPGTNIHLKCALMKRSGEKLTFLCKKSRAVSDRAVAERGALWGRYSETAQYFIS